MSKELKESQSVDKVPIQIFKLPEICTVSAVQSPSTVPKIPKNELTNVYVVSSKSTDFANLDSTGVFKVPYPPELNALSLRSKIPLVLKPLSNISHARALALASSSRKRTAISPNGTATAEAAKRQNAREEKVKQNVPGSSDDEALGRSSSPRRRKASSENSGLRYFAAKVSEKVKEKKVS